MPAPKAEPPAKTAQAPRPDAETPVPHEEAPHEQPQALAETPAKRPEAPVEQPAAPAKQPETPAAPAPHEAVAAKPPVEPAAPAAQPPAAAFSFASKPASALSLPALGRVERQEISVATKTGGSAEVEVHVLPGSAGGRASARASRRGLSAYLESGAFPKGARPSDAVVCVGLGSRGEPVSTPELLRRANHGDYALCGILARRPNLSKNAKLYGLPLAQALEAGGRAGNRRVQPNIVVGIRAAKGDLAEFATQRKMIAELIRENRIAPAGFGESPKTPAARQDRYIAVKGGKSRRKHKSVKPQRSLPLLDDVLDGFETMVQPDAWSFQDQISPRRCERAIRPRPSAAQSKAIPAGRRKMSMRRMGLFPVPPQPVSRRISLKQGECADESL